MKLIRQKKKPVIGVTGPRKGGTAAWLFSWWAVLVAGGRAVRIRPGQSVAYSKLDGLIIGGGADIDPSRYGAKAEKKAAPPKPRGVRGWIFRIFGLLFYPLVWLLRKGSASKESGIDTARDRLEFDLAEAALDDNMPVLGICRGAQLLNVATGGTLHQDLGGFYSEVPNIHSIRPRKKVHLQQDTRLYKVLQADWLYVNALHNQAVDELGEGMVIAAREANGVVQAIESTNHDFVIGVQWHPEYMPQIEKQRGVFRALVDSA